ncbi:uncharacterized protein LOC115625357 [Scaptodrosophila lebanonensis]|uniref:Uncharacterized protein LOC115625357 n=1 Tax=Drosophila lebanonensis TaxID=7225 RepID=A0A6J2TMM5_DROLE|nr:uncharacterized protein LOC115625357 [Scaptodrosophila lebanonensis]
MPKFGASAISESISFSFLEFLASVVLRETQELETDFHTHVTSLREKLQDLRENEQNLIEIDGFTELLKNCVMTVPLELNQNECDILGIERPLRQIEQFYTMFSGEERNIITCSNYMDLLKLLLSVNSSMEQCNSEKTELEEYKKESFKHTTSQNLPAQILSIMECHAKALERMGQQITELQEQSNKITKSFEHIAHNMGVPSATSQLCCEMAKEVEDAFEDL